MPALATAWSSSKVTARRSRLWQDERIEKVPSGQGIDHGFATRFSLTGVAFSWILDRPQPPSTPAPPVDPGLGSDRCVGPPVSVRIAFDPCSPDGSPRYWN